MPSGFPVCEFEQALHPVQAVAQQTPSMQCPLAHWPSPVQAVPLGEVNGASEPSGIVDASGVAVVPPVAFGASGAELPPEPVPPAPPNAVVVPPSPPAEEARSKAPSSEGLVPAPASALPPIAPAPSQDELPAAPPAELPEPASGPVPFFQQVLVLLAQ